MRRAAGRLQTVGAGMLVLAVTVAAPALSAAQEGNAEPGDPGSAQPGVPVDPGAPTEGAAETVEQVQTAPAPVTVTPEPQAAKNKKAIAKPAASKTVTVGDNFFTPDSVTINAGDTVTWKNDGLADHNATADDGSFATGNMKPGQSRSETFTQAGNVPYYCTLHGKSVQSGTVKVLAASGGGGGSGGSGADTSSGTSEAAAVSSPGAAGSSSSLPATGFAALVLAAIGVALVGSGGLLKRVDERGPRKRRVRYFSY
jgi:LPXTG-motif cell wall-anchored protein